MGKTELGQRGEQAAAEMLEADGLVVLSRNWRCREGELDIVATDAVGTLVICEVKTRSGTGYGQPVEAVTQGKRRRLRRLAVLWLADAGIQFVRIRFDVIGVLWPPGSPPEFDHRRGAF